MSRRERKILRKKGKKYNSDKTIEDSAAAIPESNSSRKKQSKLLTLYETSYKKAMWITIIFFVISIIIIGVQIARTGEFIPRGVSLKGGVTITVPYEGSMNNNLLLQNLKGEFPQASISVRAMTSAGETIGFIVDASDVDPEELLAAVKDQVGEIDKFSLETMGSALGNAFFKQTLIAILIAFALMSIVVFLAFKTFVPSVAVILSAVSDITMTVAAINVLGIRIETAGIAALLMLIGYSVDTDVLLTTRVVKREEGTVFDRTVSAMKTGLTMTFTSIAAVTVALIFTQSETLRQIMLILLIGLIFDLPNTWIQNAGILRMYMERKAKKKVAATLAEYGSGVKEAEFEEVEETKEEFASNKSDHHKHEQHTHEHRK